MFKIHWLLVFLVVMLTACAELQSHESTRFIPVKSGESGVNKWLSELHDTHAMTPEQLQQTLMLREREFRHHPGPGNCLRLALLLAVGNEPIRDQKRAMILLNEICPGQYSAGERELVVILRQFLGEQGEASKRIHEMSKQVREQNQRIEELEQQQRALTTIEQTIQQRENPPETENEE